MARKKNGKNGNQAVADPPEALQVITPVVSPEEAEREWKKYLKLCEKILDPQDYVYYVHFQNREGYEQKPKAYTRIKDAEEQKQTLAKQGMKAIEIRWRKRRSAWDKLARFYNLTVPKPDGLLFTTQTQEVGEYIIENRMGESVTAVLYQRKDDLVVVKASVSVVVRAPNGRSCVGEGVCSVSERKHGASSFAHADHDIPTTAFTRAMNRAISRCIGTGEVSAEEMDAVGETETEKVDSAASVTAGKKAPAKKDKVPAKETQSEKTKPTPPKASQPASSNGFKPDPKGKFRDRVTAIKHHLFGPTDNSEYTVELFLLALDQPVKKAVRVNGSLSNEKINAAFLSIENKQRYERLAKCEAIVAETASKEACINWMRERVAAWEKGLG